jgi:hypothetical protein
MAGGIGRPSVVKKTIKGGGGKDLRMSTRHV